MGFRPLLNRVELEQLRVHKGDTVIFNGERYVVREAGLKYLRLSRLDGKSVAGLIHRQHVRKLDADEIPTSPLDDFTSSLPFDRSDLLKRR